MYHAKVTCDVFPVPRKRRLIKINSVIFGKANSLRCTGRLEDRCYDFQPNFTETIKKW